MRKFNFIFFTFLFIPIFLGGQVDKNQLFYKKFYKEAGISLEKSHQIEIITLKTRDQGERDKEQFKSNGLALINAAKRRRQITDQRILEILNVENKNKYKELSLLRDEKFVIFYLSEGLLLNDHQLKFINALIDNYKSESNSLKTKIKRKMKEKGGKNNSGGMSKGNSGRMFNSMESRGGRRSNGMSKGYREGSNINHKAKFQDLQDITLKKIKEILSKDQKKRLKQIKGLLERELSKAFPRWETRNKKGHFKNY